MRLARAKGTPPGTSLMVAEVAPPHGTVAPLMDYAESFGAEWKRLHAPLISYAERFVSKEDAADAVGDAMESIWRRWPSVVRETPGDGYFYSAVHNRVADRLEANDRLVSLDDAEEELDRMAFDAEPRPSRGDTKSDIIRAAIAELPPKRRATILLLKEQDITYAQAAEILGVTIGTVNSHVHKANAHIRAAVIRAGLRLAKPQPPRLPAPKGGDTND